MKLELTESGTLRERVYHTEVSGLGVYIIPKPGFLKKHTAFAIDYGSVDTSFRHPRTGEIVRVPDGMAHFLEHKMFEASDGSPFEKYAKIGAFCNAVTNYTSTTYMFSASDHFDEGLRILLGFVQKPDFSDRGIETEKSIVEQELRMLQDRPSDRVEVNLLRALYVNNPAKEEVGGTTETIKTINRQHLELCHETFYQPSNMALVVVGDVNPERVVEIAHEKIIARPLERPVERIYPQEPQRVARNRVEAHMRMSMPLALVGFKDAQTQKPRWGKQLLLRQAAGDILTTGMFGRSSHTFERLYEQRLVSDRFSANFDLERIFGYAAIGGETPEPERLIEQICRAIEAARRSGIDSEVVSRIRSKLTGDFVMLFNSLEFIAQLSVATLFKGGNVFDYYEALKSVGPDDVNDLLQETFRPDRMAVSIARP